MLIEAEVKPSWVAQDERTVGAPARLEPVDSSGQEKPRPRP